MHCNIFFPNSVLIHKILWIDSGKRPPAVPCQTSRSPPPAVGSVLPVTSLKGRRVMRHGNTVGAAEAGSRCLTLSETVNSQRSQAHPGCCTVRPRVALSSGERGGVSVNVTPSCLAGGRRDGSHVYVYVRQKCTMQSQKQWHFLSLTMVALFYN